jgi:hypothetical protein
MLKLFREKFDISRIGDFPSGRRWDYGEDRYRLLGTIEGRIFVVVFMLDKAPKTALLALT